MKMTRTLRKSLFAGIGIAFALCTNAAAEDDYSKFLVLGIRIVQDLPPAGGLRGVLLSPDGGRLLQLGGNFPDDVCLWAPAQIGPWVKFGCAELAPEDQPGPAQDMLWSPTGSQL